MWTEIPLLAKVVDLDEGRALLVDDGKWPVTDILLYIRITRVESVGRWIEKSGEDTLKATANETLCIENS